MVLNGFEWLVWFIGMKFNSRLFHGRQEKWNAQKKSAKEWMKPILIVSHDAFQLSVMSECMAMEER